MNISSIKEVGLRGKRVILRADFNLPMEKGVVVDDFRLERSMPTINFLKEQGAKIIIMSYVSTGRGTTLKPVADFFNDKYFKVGFLPTIEKEEVNNKISEMSEGDVLLLENIHKNAEDREADEKNDEEFAQKLASFGDIFVNDAFGQSHRRYSSIIGIPKILPSYAGFLMEEEIAKLSDAFNPEHPFLLILGGIKFESKLGVLDRFIEIADKVFIGGALANNFFKAQGIDIGDSLFDADVDISHYLNNPKILLPIDIKKREGNILDCGDKTIEMLSKEINNSKFVLWNGPLGDFEDEAFDAGTKEIAEAIAESSARAIIGGGDTVAAIHQSKAPCVKERCFVSTGGGAMLAFLADGTLPGIKTLQNI